MLLWGRRVEVGFSFSGFIEVKRRRRGSGYSCWCTKECDSEGDLGLEAEILKFMKNSEKPELFPSKKELLDAGRMDLVEAIQKRGGWLALGWDLDYGCDSQEEQEQQYRFQENGFQHLDFRQTENAWNNGDLKNNVDGEVQSSRASSCSPSSSGRSLEAAAEDGSGIEGLLNRLEKERNNNFGFGFNEKEISARFPSNDHNDDFLPRLSTTIVTGPERRRSVSNSSRGIIDDGGGKISHNQSFLGVDGIRHGNSIKPDIWRNLSIQRAGPSDMEFEDISGDKTLEIGDRSSELDRRKESNSFEKDINPDKIRGHLEHLELELSSVLQSLRSDADNVSSQEDDGSSKYNLQNLSDALEFQQNEILAAQAKLRSIRAKLAVLEGKMALSIIDTQKIVEQKQRRIDDARRAVQLLRTAYIVWPNSASKVLLAGSFDGWATQRKMERSQTGVFSLYLKLYPGRYEMKFIVDGKWMIDPLRPIVHNNGHENNLLIIT